MQGALLLCRPPAGGRRRNRVQRLCGSAHVSEPHRPSAICATLLRKARDLSRARHPRAAPRLIASRRVASHRIAFAIQVELRVNQRVSTHPSDSARLPAPLRSVRSARARTAVRVSAEADGCCAMLSERLNPDFHPVCKRHCQSDVRPALPIRGCAALLALRCRPRWYAETPPVGVGHGRCSTQPAGIPA